MEIIFISMKFKQVTLELIRNEEGVVDEFNMYHYKRDLMPLLL